MPDNALFGHEWVKLVQICGISVKISANSKLDKLQMNLYRIYTDTFAIDLVDKSMNLRA